MWDTYDHYFRANSWQYNVADKTSVARQRAYNTLCLAYGSDAPAFQDLIEQGLLPETRARNCIDEYRQVQRAFEKTILPHLDLGLLKQARSMRWLAPEDLR